MTTPNRKLLHRVLAHNAANFSDQPAVVDPDGDISHAELQALADHIADFLVNTGTNRDATVALYLNKGIAFVASMLGCMNAGCRFMALDPTYPAARLRTMLELNPAAALLTTPSMAEQFPADADQVPVRITIDAQHALAVDDRRTNTNTAGVVSAENRRPLGPTDPCYVVFTSGSTGTPKGVIGSYQALSHYIHWHAKEFAINREDRIAQLAPVGFDACFKDIFVALLAGATVVIPPPDITTTPTRLARWIGEQGITTLQTVPALLRLILAELEAQPDLVPTWRALKRGLFAGEPLFGRDVQRWRQTLGADVEIANLYGLTETTILKTCHRHVAVPDNPRDLIHVGHPISNSAVLIIKGKQLCDIGRIGEIYIKSPFLTLGFLDPEQTRERFVVNPLTGKDDDLLFRTGDLGRYGSEREITVLGRQDNQIKVNGVRIETNEIETHLLAFHAVREAAVVALKNKHNDVQIACYYTERTPVNVAELRAHLAEHLPAVMIPGFFIKMTELPLSLNGKVNRKALPQPQAWLAGGKDFEPPRGETETRLAAIWEDVLALEKVGATIPFFETGGHSLKATRILARIYREFDCDISLRDFFQNDTIRRLARLIEQTQSDQPAPIPRVAEADHYPVSHAQYRLWVLDRMDEERIAYSMPGAYMFSGSLDLDCLQQAFATLIERHESLRTTFNLIDGELRQVIHPQLPGGFQMTVIESVGGEENAEDTAVRAAREDAKQPFDLAHGPLLRVKVVQRNAEQWVVLFNVHHIVCDGWSVNTLGNEWIALYRAYRNGAGHNLTPPPLQYKDFAAWQNAALAGDEGTRLRDFWRRQFRTLPAPLDFPTDFKRPPVPGYRGRTLQVPFDDTVARAIDDLARRRDVTRFQLLTAAVFALMHRATGQTDLVLGSPVAGRPHPDLHGQVGFYVNMLALRQDIDPRESFNSFLARVKQTVIAAADHQNYPFDRLVDELKLSRESNRAPLFDVMVALESPEVPQLEEDGLSIRELTFETGTSRYDLLFVFVEEGAQLSLKLNYNSDLFRPERMQHLADHTATLLAAICSGPDVAVGNINLLSDQARARALAAAPGPMRHFPVQRRFVDLVQAHAVSEPRALAMIHGASRLTYAELFDKARRVAAHLQQAPQFRVGDPVGLMVARGEHALVGLLGTLLAGGVFLPLDPFYPAERLAHMRKVSACKLLLCDAAHRGSAGDAAVVDLEAAANDENAFPHDRDNAFVKATALIFTSGSTGHPKGIWVPDAGLVNTAFSLVERFGVQAQDRVLQFAAYSFDIFLAEVFTTLCAGATLVVADRDCINEPSRFIAMLAEQGVTVASMPTAYLNALNQQPMPSLRVLITGGEAPNPETALFYAARTRYFNSYGLTEACAYSTVFEIDAGGDYRAGVPIGKPLANMELHLLDGLGRPVADGLVGEICIAGAGLALGYVNDPQRTAERFVPHPFKAKQRMLRSGDLGRRLADGNILFLGRADSQVKIRGHRVEPGEIERCAAKHDAVAEVHVCKFEALGELVAYLIPRGALDVRDLKNFLSKTLPSYMVPAYFVTLARFPLSSTGKIDGAALPDPRDTALTPGAQREARNPLEQKLLALWRDILGRHALSIDDDFFEAGGTSILVVKLTAAVNEQLGLNVAARQVFLHPTVAELAEALDETVEADGDQPLNNAPAPVNQPLEPAFETRCLLRLIAAGRLAPVDAVALDTLSDDLPAHTGLSRAAILADWCGHLPVLSGIRETAWGRIGLITLPRFDSTLFDDPAGLVANVAAALATARCIGADAVSLTGLLPAALDHGRLLAPLWQQDNTLPRLTTGRDTVAAATAATLATNLADAKRELGNEQLGLLGLDAVALAAVGLLLKNHRHPQRLLVCDPDPRRRDTLQGLLQEVGYRGAVQHCAFKNGLENTFYAATVVLGSGDVQAALQLDQLRPGTLLITESGRPAVDNDALRRRIQEQDDMRASESDILQLPQESRLLRYLPAAVAAALPDDVKNAPRYSGTITGCVLAGLLLHHDRDQQGLRGPVTVAAAQRQSELLQRRRISAAVPHLDGEPLAPKHAQPLAANESAITQGS